MKITEQPQQSRPLDEYTILNILQTSPNLESHKSITNGSFRKRRVIEKVLLLGRASRGAHRPKGSRRRERNFLVKLLDLALWIFGILLYYGQEEIRKIFESQDRQEDREMSRQIFLKAVRQAQRANRTMPERTPSGEEQTKSITLFLYPCMELSEKYNRMRFIREGMNSCPSILVSFSHNFNGRTVTIFFKRTTQFNLWELQKAIDYSREDTIFLP